MEMPRAQNLSATLPFTGNDGDNHWYIMNIPKLYHVTMVTYNMDTHNYTKSFIFLI